MSALMRRVLGMLVFFAITAAWPALVFSAGQPPPRVQLQGEVDLPRLVDLCAQRLDLTVEYDASVLKGKVTLRLTESLTDAELWELTNRVLGLRGFTTVRLRGVDGREMLSVVRLADAAGLAEVEDVDARGDAAAGFVAVVVRVEHQPIRETSEALKAILSRTGSTVTTLGNSNLLLIADLRPRVEQALQFLQTLDTPGAASVVERIELLHLPATRLAAMLTSITAARDLVEGRTTRGRVVAEPGDRAVVLIAPGSESDAWRSLISRFDQVPPVETRTYSPRYFGLDEVAALIEQVVRPTGGPSDQWRLVRDQLTGSIILTATALQHEEVQALIDRLNTLPAESRRPLRTFQVRNRPVGEVIAVLERLVSSGVLAEAAESANETPDRSSTSAPPATDAPRLVPGSPQAEPRPPSTDQPSAPARQDRPSGRTSTTLERPALTLTADETTSTIIAMGDRKSVV